MKKAYKKRREGRKEHNAICETEIFLRIIFNFSFRIGIFTLSYQSAPHRERLQQSSSSDVRWVNIKHIPVLHDGEKKKKHLIEGGEM